MLSCRNVVVAFLLFIVLPPAIVKSAERPSPVKPLSIGVLQKPSLLRQFDVDTDGKLSQSERKKLRDAFGGKDVPMLPAKPYRYTRAQLPNYLSGKLLRTLDNTPKDNPLTDEGARLGRVLFYDRQLSHNDTIACASCHLQRLGFSDPRQFSVGFQGGHTKRNAMGLANMRYTNIKHETPGFFWDERAATLEDQALMPIQDSVEMGMGLAQLEAKLTKIPYFSPLFQAAFGSPQVTREKISKAIAQFMRSLVSFDSRYDRASQTAAGQLVSQDFADFTEMENLGKSIFIDGVGGVAEIGCAHCHVPPTFGMQKSLNNGLELVYSDQGLGTRGLPSNDLFTKNNDGKFKAPSLRNIALTGPYMHDGRFKTLQQVIDHYSTGVHPHVNVGLAFEESEPDAKRKTSGFHLTNKQKTALIAFLETLTDKTLITDPKFSDPFIRLIAPIK